MTNLAKSTLAAVIVGSLGTAALAGNGGVEAEAGVSGSASGAVETAQSTATQAGKAATSAAREAQNDVTEMAKDGARADAQVSYGTVISGLNNGTTADAAARIEALGADITVDTVLLSEIDGANQAKALDNALNAKADVVAEFRDVIEANAEITAALEAEGFEAEDVVSVQSEGGAEVTLVIDDRA